MPRPPTISTAWRRADSLRDEFLQVLAGAEANPVASPAEIARLRSQFLVTLRRSAHDRDVDRGRGTDMLAGNLETMRASFAALRLALDSATVPPDG